jgi:hypothetical protein
MGVPAGVVRVKVSELKTEKGLRMKNGRNAGGVMWVLEKNVPLAAAPGEFGWATECVRRMKKGDSVLVPEMRTATSMRRAALRSGVGLALRSMKRGVRVWRVR